MTPLTRFITTAVLVAGSVAGAGAADQTVPGQGNANAAALAAQSPLVQSAMHYIVDQAQRIKDQQLHRETLDAVTNPQTCVQHRAGLTDTHKQQIVYALIAAGLVNPNDAATITGDVQAGVFPPVQQDGSACPQLPQPFYAAPGSAYIDGHHSYPGGLPVHEANNEVADVHLADEYRDVYGSTSRWGFAIVAPEADNARAEHERERSAVSIDQDIILAAPLWHDWAKSMVFQWNADGSEFTELNFGGTGTNDAWGAPGDSRTGGHHIISVAEAMKRGLSPAFVITQACAHSAPTSGNEYKVVNWLRAAAIIADIDPVQAGYLTTDSQGRLRLPALRALGAIDLNATNQTNLLAEYVLHNLSDADFTYSGPAVATMNVILRQLAPQYGYDPTNTADYQNRFRNVVLSYLSGERLLMIYSEQGLDGVKAELDHLKAAGVI